MAEEIYANNTLWMNLRMYDESKRIDPFRIKYMGSVYIQQCQRYNEHRFRCSHPIPGHKQCPTCWCNVKALHCPIMRYP